MAMHSPMRSTTVRRQAMPTKPTRTMTEVATSATPTTITTGVLTRQTTARQCQIRVRTIWMPTGLVILAMRTWTATASATVRTIARLTPTSARMTRTVTTKATSAMPTPTTIRWRTGPTTVRWSRNSTQIDSDSDGQGDVCDSDLDGDSVANGADNCPLAANSGQTDLDGDGQGDVCDNDADGDDVSNDSDQCPGTPAGSNTDPTNGCSIAQLCPCGSARYRECLGEIMVSMCHALRMPRMNWQATESFLPHRRTLSCLLQVGQAAASSRARRRSSRGGCRVTGTSFFLNCTDLSRRRCVAAPSRYS